jgi:DNA-binding response OmpR family regulator
MNLLYVDDDQGMATLVELMLRKEGYSCDTASLGQEAVDLGKSNKYDIILLDVLLPDMDGYEVMRALQAAEVHTPILIQTGLLDRNDDLDWLESGASEYLIKPFTKSELVQAIRAVASRSGEVSLSAMEELLDCQETSLDLTHERRQHRRFRTVKVARILHDNGIFCIVVNMSQGGAMIQLPGLEIKCPPTFELQFGSGSTRHCLVSWTSQHQIGVEFLQPN